MGNIFQISQELLDIFQEIEDNGGELTEELESQLAISQADFKTKVKNYTDVIKQAESDIKLVDEEISRLKDLKESKKKAIERLKKIIIWAVDMFGDETKSGGKYIDYGTGKISVRNSEKVETNDELVDNVVNNVFSYLNQLSYTNELEEDNLDCNDLLKALKNTDNPINITDDELYNIQANLSFNVNIRDLIFGNGLEFTKKFFKFINSYKVKSNIDKTIVKGILKEGNADLHNIASIVPNKTVQIK